MPSHTDEWIQPDDAARRGRRRAGYVVATTFLALVVGGAAVEATGVPVYGVHSRHVTDSAGAWDLDVHYGDLSRPALATPFEIEVHHEGGFDGPITISVSHGYLALWDENGLDPAASEETADDDDVLWTFEPPDGDVLLISFDARIEPAAQTGRDGHVAILDSDGSEIVAVDFRTRILP